MYWQEQDTWSLAHHTCMFIPLGEACSTPLVLFKACYCSQYKLEMRQHENILISSTNQYMYVLVKEDASATDHCSNP